MLTESQQQSIRDFLEGRYIRCGLGNEKSACSIASINLALYGKLTDVIPCCMSEVIGHWIITIQDSMPDEIRNSNRWRSLLPLAAGTGREHEAERLDLLLEWMYEKVLPTLQPLADANGFGTEWLQMCVFRTEETVLVAKYAAQRKITLTAAWAASAAHTVIVEAGTALGTRASSAAAVATATATVTKRAAVGDENVDFWNKIDPCEILEKMIKI